jgi:hypothetical protein
MRIVDDFLDKGVCPYCGEKLKTGLGSNGADVECSKDGYFRFIDSVGPSGYYLPKEFSGEEYCFKTTKSKN